MRLPVCLQVQSAGIGKNTLPQEALHKPSKKKFRMFAQRFGYVSVRRINERLSTECQNPVNKFTVERIDKRGIVQTLRPISNYRCRPRAAERRA